MIKGGSSNIRKFQFFEVIKEVDNNPPQKNDNKDSNKESVESNQKKLNIEINNIMISGLRQMYAIDGLVFINGKAIHEKDGKKIRENLIMKILNNKIIDVYRLYNGVYFDFRLKSFNGKPYFIVVGSDFKEFKSNQFFMITSIKIYDASTFISKEEAQSSDDTPGESELYPEFLKNNIQLLKRKNDGKIVCSHNITNFEDNIEEYESIQNVNSFTINDNFTHAAVSIDREGIILICGYPNLLEKNIKIVELQQIILDDKLANITNLEFADLNIINENKKVLYATTGKSIYYYIWNNEIDKNSKGEENILLRALNEDGVGASIGCIAVKGQYLLIGSSNDDFIGEYKNLEFGKTWFFEGKKAIVNYFNDYILFVIYGDSESSLQIYDRKNQFFVYYIVDKKKIISICNDGQYLYIFYEESINKKYIVKLREKNIKEKFETFFSKKFYDDAALYAKNLGFDNKRLTEISRQHAEYEYNKGNYDKAIDEYIKTIHFYEPSIVIRKFLEKSKLVYLIKYLEAIVFDKDFKNRDIEEHNNYTILLFHCYIMQEEIHKLKEFMDNKGKYFSQDLIKTVIDVCIEIENYDMGLTIAQQYKMIKEYIQILIIYLNKPEEAINVLDDPLKYEFSNSNKERVELYIEFDEYFLKIEEGKEDYSDKFFQSVLKFIETNLKDLDKKDIVRLVEIFLDTDKFFKILFDKIPSYNLEYDKEMIHRRIQMYLDDLELDKKNESYKNKIIEIIKDEKCQGKYDSQYLIMLFKNKHFLEGVEILSELYKYIQDILFIYMEKKQYENIINLCSNFGASELSLWGSSLNYFINKENRNNLNKEELNEINSKLGKFLDKLLESNIIDPINVLDIINEQNNEIPFDILNDFLNKSLGTDLNSIEEKQNNFNEYDKKINETLGEIKELKTKAYTFNLVYCSDCKELLDMPWVAFKCGHGFHKSCLNSIDDKNFECPKCKQAKDETLSEIKKYKEFYNSINTLDKLQNELDQKENKIDFIFELYGKGFLDLGTNE